MSPTDRSEDIKRASSTARNEEIEQVSPTASGEALERVSSTAMNEDIEPASSTSRSEELERASFTVRSGELEPHKQASYVQEVKRETSIQTQKEQSNSSTRRPPILICSVFGLVRMYVIS